MAENELQVAPRSVTGKKVAALRRAGQTPANVYGHRIESTSVQANTVDLTHLMRAMGRNALISLKIDGEAAPRTVMVRGVARNPLNGKMLHVDFYQVNLSEKMKAEVPVVLTGTSDAVVTFGGVLMQMVDVIHVEALPADLPSEYTVDVGQLTQLDQAIHVRDLHIDETKVSVLSDPDIVVARVAAPRLAAEEEEAAEAAPVEGEEPAEGAAAEAPVSESE
jgi:large subunit ribosomal protein L25